MTTSRGRGEDQTPARRPAARPSARKGTGRPSLLTDEVANKVLAAARAHQRIEVAAEIAGVGRETLYGWLRQGARARDHLARGERPSALTPLERRCAEFTDDLMRALAFAEGTAVNSVVRAGSQPSVETKRTTRCVGLNDEGVPIYAEEVTTTERPPDWRAHTWWLERRVTAYHLRQSVELTGADGGPIEIDFAARLEGVVQKIRAYQASIAVESQETTATRSSERSTDGEHR